MNNSVSTVTDLTPSYTPTMTENNGAQMRIDPKTGFMEFVPYYSALKIKKDLENGVNPAIVDGERALVGFSVRKKLLFLKKFRKTFPNVFRAAKAAGVSRPTVVNHTRIDPKFAECVQEIYSEMADETLSNFQKFGKGPKNFMDRMAVARAVFPETYDPIKRVMVSHTGSGMTPSASRNRLQGLGQVIDADVVQAQFDPAELNAGTPIDTAEKSA